MSENQQKPIQQSGKTSKKKLIGYGLIAVAAILAISALFEEKKTPVYNQQAVAPTAQPQANNPVEAAKQATEAAAQAVEQNVESTANAVAEGTENAVNQAEGAVQAVEKSAEELAKEAEQKASEAAAAAVAEMNNPSGNVAPANEGVVEAVAPASPEAPSQPANPAMPAQGQ